VTTLAGCHQGQRKSGVKYGYTAFLTPIAECDHGNMVFNDFRNDEYFTDPIYGSYVMGNNIVDVVKKYKEPLQDISLITLGGDHTISYGTIYASTNIYSNLKVLWIDAHPDVNTPESSLSGNCHGMPVAYLLGLATKSNISSGPIIKKEDLVYIGLRSIDDFERKILDDEGIKYYTADIIKEMGVMKMLCEIKNYWNLSYPELSTKIHISLDVDSIDPEYTPATGTPVPNGLTLANVMKIIDFANSHSFGEHANIDITEVNPDLSDVKGVCKTYKVCTDIMDRHLKRPFYWVE
jgi:arginase